MHAATAVRRAAPTIELVGQALAIWQHHALLALPWQQQVQQHQQGEPAHIYKHGLMRVNLGCLWEARDQQRWPHTQAACLVATIHQAVDHSWQDEDEQKRPVRPEELPVLFLMRLLSAGFTAAASLACLRRGRPSWGL